MNLCIKFIAFCDGGGRICARPWFVEHGARWEPNLSQSLMRMRVGALQFVALLPLNGLFMATRKEN